MKSYLKRVRRNIYEFMGSTKYSRPALFDIDRKLANYLNYKKGFFIEVGANDGYNQSNTYYLEKILDWRGILVEPIPELFYSSSRIHEVQ